MLKDTKVQSLPENIEKKILAPWTRIRHDIFGIGTIIDFDEQMNAHIIKFDILDATRKLNVKVKLEVV